MNAAGAAFEWTGPIDVIDSVSNYSAQSTSDATNWTDITGLTKDLTLTKPCYIFVSGNILAYTSNASYGVQFRANIDGNGSSHVHRSYAQSIAGNSLFDRRDSVAAGVRNVKIQFRSGQAAVNAGCFGGAITAWAVPS
jgi:hypothetical protein